MVRVEKCDVLVIGSGAAGIRAAIELQDNKVDVLVVGKCAKRDAHTILATGEILKLKPWPYQKKSLISINPASITSPPTNMEIYSLR